MAAVAAEAATLGDSGGDSGAVTVTVAKPATALKASI